MQTVKQTLSDIRAHESHNYTLLTRKKGNARAKEKRELPKHQTKRIYFERTNKQMNETDELRPTHKMNENNEQRTHRVNVFNVAKIKF